MCYKPLYLNLNEEEWKKKIDRAFQKFQNCDICPHNCGVNRLLNEKGVCKTSDKCLISSFGAHLGEEDCLRGLYGSGTIFFTGCNLLCAFCQNYDISHYNMGREITYKNLANIMLELQRGKCHNINLVTPTHFLPQILKALYIAVQNGLTLPIVYNTGGYDKVESLKILENIVDIYMPDIKFFDSKIAAKYTLANHYWEIVSSAVKEMHRQVGNLVLNTEGIAQRGLLVRHLVMPGGIAQTDKVMSFLAKQISPDTYVNIMGQYRPMHAITKVRELNRRISDKEYKQAVDQAKKVGIYRLE